MTLLRIKRCANARRWYSHLVGETVPYLGTLPIHYRSRTIAGLAAVVEFEDAEIEHGPMEVQRLPTRVYISGPMTGLPDLNFPAFNSAALLLEARGFEVTNPASLNPDPSATWAACMRVDIKALCDCDILALLPGWEQSNGAHLEMHVAHRIGMRIVQLWELLKVQAPGTLTMPERSLTAAQPAPPGGQVRAFENPITRGWRRLG